MFLWRTVIKCGGADSLQGGTHDAEFYQIQAEDRRRLPFQV